MPALFEQPWPEGDYRFFQLGFVVDDLSRPRVGGRRCSGSARSTSCARPPPSALAADIDVDHRDAGRRRPVRPRPDRADPAALHHPEHLPRPPRQRPRCAPPALHRSPRSTTPRSPGSRRSATRWRLSSTPPAIESPSSTPSPTSASTPRSSTSRPRFLRNLAAISRDLCRVGRCHRPRPAARPATATGCRDRRSRRSRRPGWIPRRAAPGARPPRPPAPTGTAPMGSPVRSPQPSAGSSSRKPSSPRTPRSRASRPARPRLLRCVRHPDGPGRARGAARPGRSSHGRPARSPSNKGTRSSYRRSRPSHSGPTDGPSSLDHVEGGPGPDRAARRCRTGFPSSGGAIREQSRAGSTAPRR